MPWQLSCVARASLFDAALDAGEAVVGVAEAIQCHAHSVHERQMETAGLAIVVALVEVVEDSAGFQRPVAVAGEQER